MGRKRDKKKNKIETQKIIRKPYYCIKCKKQTNLSICGFCSDCWDSV